MDLTIGELATIPGAVVAIGIIVEVAKQFGLPSRHARQTAIATGIVVVTVFATLTADITGPAEWVGIPFLAALTGASAGLASIAGYDKLTSGFNYDVYPNDPGHETDD